LFGKYKKEKSSMKKEGINTGMEPIIDLIWEEEDFANDLTPDFNPNPSLYIGSGGGRGACALSGGPLTSGISGC
jgi:hypothetical protein